MYQIKCDGYPLLDLRDEEFILGNPKVKVGVNTVGDCSFTIYKNHPYYSKIQKLTSVIEVSDEIGVIFRGRVTEDTIDFNNSKAVDVEGVMTYFSDSIVRPIHFPGNFWKLSDYQEAHDNGNVVEYLLNYLITQHNEQVQDFQRFKLGNVTVTAVGNILEREETGYKNTWEVLKSMLFGSDLGGFLCIRYEDDGNYIDYLSEFPLTNSQPIEFGENLLDITSSVNAGNIFTAVIPIGGEVEEVNEDGTVTKKKATLADVDDYEEDGYIKKGDTVYKQEYVDLYGFIYAPISETTWNNQTLPQNLFALATLALEGQLGHQGIKLSSTIKVTAVDLHYSDEEIQSFRIYRNVIVRSPQHGHDAVYQLTELDIDILNPQNTKITVGNSQMTLVDVNALQQSSTVKRVQTAEKDIEQTRSDVTEVRNQLMLESTQIINTCNEIILSALESYVETANYEEFKSTVEAQLSIMADEISMNFTNTIEQIENVDGDLQTKFTELYKYIKFNENGITIGDGETGLTLSIDNDMISFQKNGQQFGWWDGVDFHTGNIVVDVNERAQFGNFAFVPRADGSLSFLKVGGS